MKIKLKRKLWNHESGETIEASDLSAEWAIRKGFAEPVEEVKAIEQDYKTKVIEVPKNKGGRPKK